jgi:hypothetical protein
MKWFKNLFSKKKVFPELSDVGVSWLTDSPVYNIKLGSSFKGHSMNITCDKIKDGMTLTTYQNYYSDVVTQFYNSVTDETETSLIFQLHRSPLWYKQKWDEINKELDILHGSTFTRSAEFKSETLTIYMNREDMVVRLHFITKGIDFYTHVNNINLIKKYKHVFAILRNNFKNSITSNWLSLNINSRDHIVLPEVFIENIDYK